MEKVKQSAVLSSTVQANLPPELLAQFQRIRTRYAADFKAAQAGDYERAQGLHAASRWVGRLLAREARKSLQERGGLRMLDLSLAVDQFFPELRGWTQHQLLQHQRERMRQQTWVS